MSLLALSALVAIGCDAPVPDDEPAPPDALEPGAALDSEIEELAATLVVTPDDPAELVGRRVRDALLMLGFGVRDLDGFVLANDEHPQHLTFEDWDTYAMGVGLTQGLSASLDDFAGVLAAFTEELGTPVDAATLRAAMLEDIARAAASDDEAARVTAQLLVALGRQGATPYDLLDPDVAGDAQLDALQLGLITLRMSAALWQSVRNPDGSERTQGLEGPLPCTMTDTEGTVLDGFATGTGLTWSAVLSTIGDAADTFGTATSVANALLVWVKYAWTVNAFRMRLVADPNPLLRTATTTAGEAGTVVATAWLDGTGAAQIMNCVRPALNLANIDFSLPQDGPLAGKIVEWRIEATGKDAVIWTTTGDVLHDETDAAGQATLGIEGVPQLENITGQTIDAIRRPVVRAFTNIKNKDIAQDLVDAAAGFGGLGALIGLPVEVLNRMPLAFNGAVTVLVRDPKKLEGDLFTIVGTYSDPTGSASTRLGFSPQAVANVTDSFEATLEVKPVPNAQGTGEMLSWSDEPTEATDTFEPEQIAGEGCTLTTSAIGRFEVFSSRHKDEVTVASAGPVTFVTVLARGHALARGFEYEGSDEVSCPPGDDQRTDAAEDVLNIAFDTSMFDGVGSSTTITQGSWTFMVTHVDTAD